MTYKRVTAALFPVLLTVLCTYVAFAGGEHSHSHKRDTEGSLVGKPASAAKATKQVKVITSDDMRFTFSNKLHLHNGDIITFLVKNDGKIPHEFSIGDESEQRAHQKMMREMPNMVHNDGNTVTVKPGETKKITWKFTGNREVVFACNIPGHYEAGMYRKEKIQSNH